MTQDPRRAAVWSRYWQGGAAHACPGSVDERLGGALAAFWEQVGHGLRASAQVLEIGAGNGAVARLLLEAGGGEGPHVDAVDLARLRPAWVARLSPAQAARVNFHEATSAESLPFEAGRFDLVAGQYAFEYMDRRAVLPELLRCSRPDGRLALVLHHRDSTLVRVAAEERRHLERVTGTGGLLDTAADLIPDLARARTPEGVRQLQGDAAAEARRRRYNELQALTEADRRASPVPDVLEEAAAASAAILQAAVRNGEATARAQLQAQREAYQDAKVRLDELLACALDESGMRELVADLSARGYRDAVAGTVEEGGRLMGWTLAAKRAA
jgi:SAM-dependent methyltransferase